MLDRIIAPPFQKTIDLVLPEPVKLGTAAGSPVYYLEGLRQNIVKIEVIFTAGKWAEPKIGLSHFTSMMLEKGTALKTSGEIAATLDLYGASLEISPGFDFVSISLYSLRSKLKPIFPLFIELLTTPEFQERELTMMMDIFRQNLKVNNEKTSFLASKLIRSKVFGELHPYGATVEESDLALIGIDDLTSFFEVGYAVHSSYVLGDLKTDELDFITEGLSKIKKRKQIEYNTVVPRTLIATGENNKEGRTQATIRLGKKSILRNHADYPDLLLATHLLGGFFGSRLMKNIREEKGLTYGISASLNAFRHDSLFVIGADVNKENVSLALVEIKKELHQMMEHPVGEEELSLAKNHFTGSLQTDMANLFSVEEKIKAIHLNALTHNFYQDLLVRIDQITPQQLMASASRYFDPLSLTEVVVS